MGPPPAAVKGALQHNLQRAQLLRIELVAASHGQRCRNDHLPLAPLPHAPQVIQPAMWQMMCERAVAWEGGTGVGPCVHAALMLKQPSPLAEAGGLAP
jgi:hypothetical protein